MLALHASGQDKFSKQDIARAELEVLQAEYRTLARAGVISNVAM